MPEPNRTSMRRYWRRQRSWLYLWLPLLAWMGLIFFLSARPDLPTLESGWMSRLVSSGAHAFMFGVLAVLWMRVLGGRHSAWLLAFGLTMLYALSDEFHQAFVPGRQTDAWDLLCDGIGAALALAIWTWVQRRRQARAGIP